MHDDKFKRLVQYVCEQTTEEPEKLGATKLNKVLWLADLFSFVEFGEPITNSQYIKLERGPVPNKILPILRELEAEGAVSISKQPFHGYVQTQYRANPSVEPDFLSREQKALVDDVIRQVCENHSATSISDLSHTEIWKLADDKEEIPHYAVFSVVPGEIRKADIEWAKQCR